MSEKEQKSTDKILRQTKQEFHNIMSEQNRHLADLNNVLLKSVNVYTLASEVSQMCQSLNALSNSVWGCTGRMTAILNKKKLTHEDVEMLRQDVCDLEEQQKRVMGEE